MKIRYCLLLSFLIYASCLFGQDRTYIQQPSIGVTIFMNKFIMSPQHPAKLGIALNYLHGLTPHTDIDLTMAGSFLAFSSGGRIDSGKHLLLEADASVCERLLPGQHSFNPFVQAGLGISRYSVYYGAFLPVGIGLRISLPGETFLLLHAQYRIPVTNTQSGHFYGSLGITGIIGKKKKRKEMHVVLPHRQEYNLASKDTDGDGIADSLDACPLAPGLVMFQGCPDTDRDGIPDKDDKCPFVRGTKLLQGCPEPDRDKDGVIDVEDMCPDLPGFRETQGCPPIQKSLQRKIALAAKNIFFETDKYVLLPASFKSLDEVAVILQSNPYLKLDVKGHTDNSGTPEKNQVLSEDRARAVLEYLSIKQGIAKERLSSVGYGSTRPIADNNTEDGKTLNRRVELTLKYY